MSFEYSPFEVDCFINRLRSLQWFCSESDKSSPKALILIPGPDGRNNPGSVNILKYLFRGSVSKSLFDETLDGPFEVLEDIVIMIKETSLSIVYSKPMKEIISPLLARVPHVIEYCYTAEEESDIDKFQQRKCEHFKRMVLESLNPDDGVGLSVPIGYDNIMDVESWPMLQSFALDSVIAPTGFFTNRHNIADISPNLEILFRTVDCIYVTNALQVSKTTIVPHVQQLLMVMQSAVPSQRKKITADDVIGPLEVMYEFGEIESAGSLEKISPPIVFFGPHTTQIGVLQQALAKSDAWRDHSIDTHLHAVFEGCEPSSGMRFCRTYFLKHGTGNVLDRYARDVQREMAEQTIDKRKPISDEDPDMDYERTMMSKSRHTEEKQQLDQEDDNDRGFREDFRLIGNEEDVSSAQFVSMKDDIKRLQELYVKLWFSLRCLSFDTFFAASDILEAGTNIQRLLNALLCDDEVEESYPFLQSLPGRLNGDENLQLHIDCMNALGEIISLEDVNDLGGACWVYIRATINGIRLQSEREPVAVAVGDTFLFSPLTLASKSALHSLRGQFAKQAMIPHMTDYCCITAEVPYFATMNGLGFEEDYTRLVFLMMRSQQLAASMRLGRALETQQSSSSQSRFPCLLDHIAQPYFDAEIKSFSSGFVVDRINRGHEVPVVVSFERHVSQVFITDLAETVSLARQRLLNSHAHSDPIIKDIADSLIGYLITFELREELGAPGNPLSSLFHSLSSSQSSCKNFSIVVRLREGEVSSTVLPALDMWKASFRMHDIPVRIGAKASLPDHSLQAMLCLLDRFVSMSRSSVVFQYNSNSQARGNAESSSQSSLFAAGTATTLFSGHELSLNSLDLDSHAAVVEFARDYIHRVGTPGIAPTAMCSLHALAEVQRLSPFAFDDLLQMLNDRTSATLVNKYDNCAIEVLVGTPGSGLLLVQSLLKQKLSDYYGSGVHIEFLHIDFTEMALRQPFSAVSHSDVIDFLDLHMQKIVRLTKKFNSEVANNNKKLVVFLTVTLNPMVHVKCCDLWICVSCVIGLRIVNITSVVSPESILPASESKGLGLGYEWWRSLTTQTLRPSSANAVLLLEASTQSPAWRAMKQLLAECNPQAHLMRVHPNIPALTSQDWEYFASRVESHFGKSLEVDSERDAFLASLGYPSHEQQMFLGHDLRHLDFKTYIFPANPQLSNHVRCVEYCSSDVWALSSVLSLLAMLFPHAKTTTYSLTPHWQAAALALTETTPGSFQRLVQLASAKVLCQTHTEELAKRFQKDVALAVAQYNPKASDDKEDVLQSLRRGMLSVVVTMTLQGETLMLGQASPNPGAISSNRQQRVLIEANSSFISLRESADDLNSGYMARMLVHGVLDDCHVGSSLSSTSRGESKDSTNDSASHKSGFLPACVRAVQRHRLQRVAAMIPEKVADEVRMRIQRLSHFRERVLPTGWWFDGHHFVNFHGANRLLRPDIDEIVVEYCAAKNIDIEKHNQLINALQL